METFTKADYINALQEKIGLDKQACAAFMDAHAQITADALAAGYSIQLRGVWVLTPILKKPNVGRNMSTGERVQIPERMGIKFIPAKPLIDKLRQQAPSEEKTGNSNPF